MLNYVTLLEARLLGWVVRSDDDLHRLAKASFFQSPS